MSPPLNSCVRPGLTQVGRVLTRWSLNRPWAVPAGSMHASCCQRCAHRTHGRWLHLGLRGQDHQLRGVIVQSGRTLSSTVLNNLASTWDSTIYPTMTTYYGKDYQDGRGLAPPDVDNNCQVQIIIYDIDGAYNTGGYFAPSFASSREAVFVDFADITLSWGRSILAHELEHLLHNALDPYENLWIDEGNADVAIYLCFGADSTLRGHVNAWTGARNNPCDGGTSVLLTTVQGISSPCTWLNTSAAALLFVNLFKTQRRADVGLRTSPFHPKQGKSVCWAAPWVKFSPISALPQPLIQTRASTVIPTLTSIRSARAGPSVRPAHRSEQRLVHAVVLNWKHTRRLGYSFVPVHTGKRLSSAAYPPANG